MPPGLAAFGCLLLVAYLFWNDLRKRGEERISWAPFVWMFLAGSRFASYWLNLGAPMRAGTFDEGSPIDRAVFSLLIIWGAIVLARREINWPRLLTNNKWIALYLVYCLASLLWSDHSFVLARRWIKDLGNPIMVLVLLTEQRPFEAVGITLRRLSFLFLPVSVLFIKYFPELGRGYTADGTLMFTGVGNQKNDLGLMCLITGIYFAWKLLQQRSGRPPAERCDALDLVLMGTLAWLLYMSNSQTSIGCFIMVTGVLLLARIPWVSRKPSRVIPLLASGVLIFVSLDQTMGVKDQAFALLGRDSTLTNRTKIWEIVREQEGNPLVGTGFMSFWTPKRTAAVRNKLGAGLNQTHNGYLEQYLNLGYVGLAFIVAIMLTALLSVRRHLDKEPAAALLRLCFLIAAALYNYTEASFYGMNNMWVLLLMASIDTSGAVESSSRVLVNHRASRPSAIAHQPERRPVGRPRQPAIRPTGPPRAIRPWAR